jgi:hypothetical protein
LAIAISTDALRQLTIFSVMGPLTFEAQMAALQWFYQEAPTKNVIWDFRGLEGSRISSSQLRYIISFAKGYETCREGGKTALIPADDVDFGLARMGQTYAEAEKLAWPIEIFGSTEEALHWIEQRDA